MAQQQVDFAEIIKKEYKKCALDPAYFLRKYAIIQHPLRGKIHFDLYDFQEDTIHNFESHQYVVVLKARQIGLSTLVAGYALWKMLFNNDFNILVIATKQDTAKNLVTKIRIMHQNLPVWLRGNCTEDNKLSLSFANGSQVKAVASSLDAGRSEALSLLILDEAAFIENADVIWTAAQATLSTGGDAIVLSTPNGMGNFFHQVWIGSQAEENGFFPTFLDWKVHPDRDEEWRAEQDKKLGPMGARQEHDADFVASGNTVIDGDLIEFYRETYQRDPVGKRAFDNNLWVWEYAQSNHNYLIVADVARGDAADKSAFHVIDLESVRQVAEYKGVIGTKEYGAMLVAIATEYNDGLLIIENSNIGWAVLQEVIDRQYKNLFYMEDDWRFVDTQLPSQRLNRRMHQENKRVPGFTTSTRTRPLIISRLNEYMMDNSVEIYSTRTFDELEVFIWNGSKPEAMDGYNDDLVMALSIGLWVRDTALRLKSQGIELSKLAIDNFRHQKGYDGVYSPRSPGGVDPYTMQIGPDAEDLRWLIG